MTQPQDRLVSAGPEHSINVHDQPGYAITLASGVLVLALGSGPDLNAAVNVITHAFDE